MSEIEHLDVLVVGAGLSGVGATCHLLTADPTRRIAVLEARAAIGGTWDLFRYPGVRSDSDMFTLGYRFRPWEGAVAIADGPSILQYVRNTAREYGVDALVRYGHKAVKADWSAADARWTVTVERTDAPDVVLTCDFLYGCTGYYRYDEGYTPDFPGLERFRGTVVHPQFWPEDLDYTGRKVVVIGSGATAVTLVPAMAKGGAGHVTMLQRSPSYVLSLPQQDPLAKLLAPLPSKVSYPIVRWKNILGQAFLYRVSKKRPERVKAFIAKQIRRQLPDVDPRHFTPSYNPWDQRLCLVPNSDLFRVIRKGTASVATDTIDTFDETGVRLASGEHLDADIVVTATGLNLQALGGMEVLLDGEPIVPRDHLTYKGMMLSGVPNLVMTMGYTNASWTLKADLVAEYTVRLLDLMKREGYATATAVEPEGAAAEAIPLIDLESGYVQRAAQDLPKQGLRAPWRLYQNYPKDIAMLRRGAIEDEALHFGKRPALTRR